MEPKDIHARLGSGIERSDRGISFPAVDIVGYYSCGRIE